MYLPSDGRPRDDRDFNVIEPFLISDELLRTLSATRQGRVSIAGYNYQAAYAVARLVSMSVRQPLLDLEDWPQRLRYDWGEDLDEVCNDGSIRFTQCKRVAAVGQPAALADVLTGFAPKWLWVPEADRARLRFRLVCPDPRFAAGGTSPGSLKDYVRRHFLTRLNELAGPHTDRDAWSADAASTGYELLFDALWGQFECVYLPAEVVDSEPAGPRLAAEKEALRVLLERGLIDPSGQSQVLGRLRRLIHDNLITFNPTNEALSPSFDRSPRRLDRADVNAAIDPWRPTTHRPPPFLLVDRTFLSEQRELERKQFVARQPEWCDVAHGHDETIKFIERDQIAALEATVLEKVVARIGRAGRLPTLFVAGAPGGGKTTITRRVAARLVDAGQLLIADTGVGLKEPPGEFDEYVQAIERLQSFGRPVVLLLDDPLYAESPWLDVLRKLNRPGLQVGVLAASPQFLLDEHKAQLRACELSTFEIARPSQHEREVLAALYGRSVSSRSEEDFLVVAMEAAAGVSFREIIDRLWLTLADGRDLSPARSLSDLPWQCRAYLFVCFFSRAYEACPETLLLKLLEMTGGVSGAYDVRTELQRMRHFAGWHIFRIGQRARANYEYQGAPITAAHTVIARQAWEQRPLAWCDVDGVIIEASVSVPEAIRDVSSLGVRLKSTSFARSTSGVNDSAFASKLIERWQRESSLETRQVCDLVMPLMIGGDAALFPLIREILIRQATPDSQGWLAALQLWFLRNASEKRQGFPAEVDILSLIQSADFSIAANRASQFGQRIERDKPLWDAFVARLLSALDGKLAWKLNSFLLHYLMAILTPRELSSRIPQIIAWLETHPEATNVRAKYLSFLFELPPEFSNLRADVARQTAKWLEENDEDTSARMTYLSFLSQLPDEFLDLRADTARRTAKWLAEHDEDTNVRAKYLSFVLQLPAEFSDLRDDVAQQTAKWLEAHPEATNVRAKYLSFLLQLPRQFLYLRANAARQTAEWLAEHDEDINVRTQYLLFLLRLPDGFSDLRIAAARRTVEWLETHPDATNVRAKFLNFLAALKPDAAWQQLASDALSEAADIIVRSGWQRRDEVLIHSFLPLHGALLRSLRERDSEAVCRVLQISHDVAAKWCVRNASARLRYDLPLP
jgi:hypothetical protein